ncbi:MAG: DUF4416 family protein [Candidatus Omnitrophica bacterium]|nr:DUF4416 family protein [Candidatus Omnitrophota bacterium]MBU1894562.1 DUF4416 family protein [Candidatus Omnitrophota bacterium]
MNQMPIKLVVSIIYKEDRFLKKAEEELKKHYGDSEAFFLKVPFDYTKYYCEEMGSPLKRKEISFKKLVETKKIPDIKLLTNKIEDKFCEKNKRTVNIDPGYITAAKLVLLTTKDFVHRVYLGKCIFAESTLFYQNNTFNAWPWTYPDYASKEMVDYFNKVREVYVNGSPGIKDIT